MDNAVIAETAQSTRRPEPKRRRATLRVWDLPVRLHHWLLVSLVAAAAATGFLAPEWWLSLHVWAGYAIGLLILLRLIWGFFGSTYARFSSFLFPAGETLAFLRQLSKGRPSHYVGHNPAGALMVFALLLVLGALTVTGLVTLGGQENQGVLAGAAPFSLGKAAAEIHELLAYLLLFMIAAHIFGVVLDSVLAKEKLVRAMVTGRKRALAQARACPSKAASLAKALLAASLVLLPIALGAWRLSAIEPSGLVAMPQNADYSAECGDCHHAYHPSLLPAESWRTIMAGLDDHFGEDASLGSDATRALSAYLTKYASEKWDTEAANNLRRVSDEDPLSITATPYWTRRHSSIDSAIFARKSVGSKGACAACHKDAATGRFDDQMIAIPNP